MGKASRTGRQRTTSRDRLLIVDACEVGAYEGHLTIRVGDPRRPPTCVAVPVSLTIRLVETIRTVSNDAEESYWDVVAAVMPGGQRLDPAVAAATMAAWLRRQDWEELVQRVPADPDELFWITHAGHAALKVPRPYIAKASLLVFDPMQLRRLGPSFQSAMASASEGETAASAAEVLRFLVGQPWPPGDVPPQVTPEAAAAEMRRRHQQFLARTPYQRPEHHNFPEARP